jgi:heterodisulfide reductase subunit A-like polyferredoxin
MDAHMKLRPLDLINKGMYVCGLAHSTKIIPESIIQAQGSVNRSLTVLSQPYLYGSNGWNISTIDSERCTAYPAACAPVRSGLHVMQTTCHTNSTKLTYSPQLDIIGFSLVLLSCST